MVDYNQLEAKSAEIAVLVVELIRTMTPDKTERFSVQNFLTAVNAAGGYIKAISCQTGEAELKRRINAAIDEVCKVMFCLDMLNHMAVVDISCFEKVLAAYEELADELTLSANGQAE